MKKILVSTDFSVPAELALARAARLAGEHGACLTLLHVVERQPLEDFHAFLGAAGSSIESMLLAEVRSRLEALGRRAEEEHGLEVTVELRCGNAPLEIARYAESIETDLVVLGARGAGFIRQFVPGATAARAIRRTVLPLLATKQRPSEPYRRVLIPVDFSEWSASALRIARAIAPEAHLLLLHVFTVPFEGLLFLAGVTEESVGQYRIAAKNEASARLRRLVDESGLAATHISTLARHGEPVPVILAQEEELGCDLIVVGKHGRSATEELLLGSVTSHLLAQSSGDVLVASRGRPART